MMLICLIKFSVMFQLPTFYQFQMLSTYKCRSSVPISRTQSTLAFWYSRHGNSQIKVMEADVWIKPVNVIISTKYVDLEEVDGSLWSVTQCLILIIFLRLLLVVTIRKHLDVIGYQDVSILFCGDLNSDHNGSNAPGPILIGK
ncbi:hypothetical protein H6P81_015538 [Aristolochia fimbriata]|uniref:Endonuclease/exonuclease/phosphatase domain-containing protein n=1 Tax=Aristolochia fimbriata TaxID=158543 RepID=A0AAV7EAF3_ARIFI|nr:hypothetical protein H6P81_015538 [Aristolochia fimbriata]